MHTFVLAQVPLGVILKSETKTEEMVDICDELHAYVPTTSKEHMIKFTDGDKDHEIKVMEDHFHHLLFG